MADDYAPEREEKVALKIYIPESQLEKLQKLVKQAVLLDQIQLGPYDKEGYTTFFQWTLAIANEHLKAMYKQARGIR